MHDDRVPVEVERLGHGKAVVVQRLHVGVLLHGGEARQVDPAGRLAVLDVVALVLDLAEGGAAEPMQLDDALLVGLVRGDVDVGLLAHADLVAHGFEHVAERERLEGEEVVAEDGQPVSLDYMKWVSHCPSAGTHYFS